MPVLSKDGCSIHYSVSGTGVATPLLCLHGGACRGSHFAHIANYFGGERRVVEVDLRGHGASLECPGPYDPPTFADDAAAILAELGIKEIIVVGHSLGGPIALEFLSRDDVNVVGIVSIDAPLILAAGMAAGMKQLVGAYDAGQGAAAFRQFMSAVVGFEGDDRGPEFLEDLCSAPDHVVGPLVEAVIDYDGVDALASSSAPILHVDAGFGVCDLERLSELRPDAWVGKTAGTGHYPHVESPDQVTSMMRHFLTRQSL